MNSTSNPERFYRFFESYGAERLNGLDESYFLDLTASEKDEAWDFLATFELGEETIKGLYILDKGRAIALIKKALTLPMKRSLYPAEREAIERCRLLIIKYINGVEPDERYIAAMFEFANSEFEDVRAELTQSLPVCKITREVVEVLKKMIFTETEIIPLASAISKLMMIHGMDFDRHDPTYKSIYLSLNSDNPKEKLSAMGRLERIQRPDYL
jgi:hypothetical protein